MSITLVFNMLSLTISVPHRFDAGDLDVSSVEIEGNSVPVCALD